MDTDVICFRCGQKGHISSECTNPAAGKRARQDSGYVIIDEPAWTTVERQRKEGEDHSEQEEQAHMIRHTGCAILDSGASTGVTSIPAADELQRQRLNANEPGIPTVSPSDRRFRFGDGNSEPALNKMTQPITAGILQGQKVDFHLIDKKGNGTLPLYPITKMRKHRMVVDYESNKIMFKDRPGEWHELPTIG